MLVLAFFLCVSLADVSLLELAGAALEYESILIWDSARFLLYFASMVDIMSHHYSWGTDKSSLYFSSSSLYMDFVSLSLVATLISWSENCLSHTAQSESFYSLPFVEGGCGYLASSFISLTHSSFWRLPTLNGFTISFWIYFTWSCKFDLLFLHMLFLNLNHKSF